MGKTLFFREEVEVVLDEKKTAKWITAVIRKYHKVPGDISIIFCSDPFLLDINQRYLNHDYFTDIITFNYNQNHLVSGDIFISTDSVMDNARDRGIEFKTELNRVIIHGVLHLIGFNDKSAEDKELMRKEEDNCLILHSEMQ